ncbi:MAG: DUF4301 family protein [Alphaproteobacteria bacterium]|nr:DUF4301 family protein [Alphaproteobacteria bacterium]
MSVFSQKDIEQIKNHGVSIDAINQQLNDFQTGFAFADIVSPATIGDGIQEMLTPDFADIFNENKNNYKIVKFVPASGAATRMFKDLFEFLSSGTMNKTTQNVLDNLTEFAFYSDLKQYLPENATPKQIIEALITNQGLNYGALPKGLLKFHKYNDENRTAIAEHLAEGSQYASANNNVNIHFTVSPEHISGFKDLLTTLVPKYEAQFGQKYNISMSTQKSETDTIAVNLDNTPFRNEDGSLLFRPAGHGALIENLNEIDADIIFIKNIDNVCPDSLRADTILHKQMLAGLGIKIQQKIFDYINALDSGAANLDTIKEFIAKKLGIKISDASNIRNVLNRPLRVCGMIKNTGEPGGGPFWVQSSDGVQTLQIIEPGQVAPENAHILKNGEYFNPVDLICFVRDYQGNKFNLTEYIDPKTGFISEKSKNGRPLRAMERPGLWNGAMAKWNTVFVEVPLSTFTPAKVVTDLINDGHKSNK